MNNGSLRYKFFLLILCGALCSGGCASLVKKFIPKKKKVAKKEIFTSTREYGVVPSPDLYGKNYMFWINWGKKLMGELGESHKSDLRSTEEMIKNLEGMALMLEDEKSDMLALHIAEFRKVRSIIEERNLSKSNEFRIRRILEKETRTIKRQFKPKAMAQYIRKDWREAAK